MTTTPTVPMPTGLTSPPPVVCDYCKKPDAGWLDADLLRGKRFKPNLLEYHCINAYYGAQ